MGYFFLIVASLGDVLTEDSHLGLSAPVSWLLTAVSPPRNPPFFSWHTHWLARLIHLKLGLAECFLHQKVDRKEICAFFPLSEDVEPVLLPWSLPISFLQHTLQSVSFWFVIPYLHFNLFARHLKTSTQTKSEDFTKPFFLPNSRGMLSWKVFSVWNSCHKSGGFKTKLYWSAVMSAELSPFKC